MENQYSIQITNYVYRAGQGGVRHRRRPVAVHAIRQERVGDARHHTELPAPL